MGNLLMYRVDSSDMLNDSPSTQGALPKWKVGDTYIKLSSSGNYESYSEVIVSKLGCLLGYNVCHYSLCKVIVDGADEFIGCASPNFVPDTKELLDYVQVMSLAGIQWGFNCFESLFQYLDSQGCSRSLVEAMVLSYLTLDYDKHLGNLGLFRDRATSQLESAPLFDFGAGLLCAKQTSQQYNTGIPQIIHCKPFAVSWDMQLMLLKDRLPEIPDYREKITKFISELPDSFPVERKKYCIDLLNTRYEDYCRLRTLMGL